MFIAVSGEFKSGKTTFAQYLQEKYQYIPHNLKSLLEQKIGKDADYYDPKHRD